MRTYSDDNDGVAGYMRNGKFVGNSKLHDDYERRMRDEARAGLPIAFLGRMIGGRIARVGMKGIAKSVAKKAAMAAATHALTKQVEKSMDNMEPTSGQSRVLERFIPIYNEDGSLSAHGRGSHAHAGVIPLDMRIG